MTANCCNHPSSRNRMGRFFTYAGLAACAHGANADQALSGVQHMSVGYYHTCAVVNGGARCFGYNGDGALGNGTAAPTSALVPVTGLGAGVTALTEGYHYSCAIVNGGAQCWGSGYLGNGTTATNSTAVGVTGLDSGVTAIAGGQYSTCAIVTGGVQCWGSGYLGDGTTTFSATPVIVFAANSNATTVAAGSEHNCAVINGGALCWGSNMYGQLGDATLTDRPTPVPVTGLSNGTTTAFAAGDAHTCAIVSGGVQCWGDNTALQLGNGMSFGNSATPAPVVGLAAGSGAIAITAGQLHTCVLVNNDPAHPVKCWGYNADGQLGNGSIVSSSTPVDVSFLPALAAGDSVTAIAAGGSSTCALVVRSGVTTMDCWGSNGYGQLGVAGPPAQTAVATAVVGLDSGVSALGMGGVANHSCAVVNGGAQCWGSNGSGQLGNGIYADTSVAQPVSGLAAGVTAMATGYQHSCAIIGLGVGAVECWGDNSHGELGNNTTTPSPTPVQTIGLNGATAIAASGDNEYFGSRTCAIVSNAGNSTAQCWGDNMFGELGDGTTTTRFTPVAIPTFHSGVTAIVTGPFHTCAIVHGGVQCWGHNPDGELGDGTNIDSDLPVVVNGAVSGATAISAGYDHTCAVVNGGAQCWGDNYYGQLGNAGLSSNVPVGVTGLGVGSGVTAISAGYVYTCAVVNGGAQCWGSNFYGELGNGTYSSSAAPVAVTGLESGVVGITTGHYHACALMSNGAEKCWGSDQYGQLGDHRFISAQTPQVVVVGDEIFANGFESN